MPGTAVSIEVGGLGLTRGNCFVAHRSQSAAVAAMLWVWWCVLSAAGFCFSSRRFPGTAHGLWHVADSLASFTSLVV